MKITYKNLYYLVFIISIHTIINTSNSVQILINDCKNETTPITIKDIKIVSDNPNLQVWRIEPQEPSSLRNSNYHYLLYIKDRDLIGNQRCSSEHWIDWPFRTTTKKHQEKLMSHQNYTPQESSEIEQKIAAWSNKKNR